MKRDLKISSLLIALLLTSGQVFAAGLGKLSVSSVLGQPLRAEIELLSVAQDDISNIDAKQATPEAYMQAHIDRSGAQSEILVRVEKRADGTPYVRLTSSTPINDPFVDLLIELNWSSGRVLREYTILLDPAKMEQPEQAQMPAAAPVVAGQTTAPAAKAAVAKSSKPSPAGKAGADTYGPVKSGDTLHSIASKVLPPDVSLDMMMASLYHENKQAFIQNNMNLLRKGQVLKVPDRDSVVQMYSPHQARQLIKEHTAAWNEMRNRVADQAARTAAETSAKGPSAESGKIVAAKPQAKPQAPAESKDVLTLSKGEASKTGKAAEADQAAKDRQLQEAQGRINDLEKTVQDLQTLLAQKDKVPAAEPAAQPAPPPPPPPKAAVPPVAKPPVTPPPPEEKGFFSTLLENPLYIGGAIGALLLAGLLWIVMVGRRRRQGLSSFEQSVMSGGDQFKTSIFKTTGGAKTETGTPSQVGATTDFSRLGLGSIDTHEVDPIAEAEVYMAYGRDAQAEEILKEALAKEPGRHEIALKLLEIYASRKDKANFETHASELYAALGDPDHPIWQKAAVMGHELDPDNPLYRMFGQAPLAPEPVAAAGEAKESEELLPASMLESDLTMSAATMAEEPEVAPEAESVFEMAEVHEPEPEELATQAIESIQPAFQSNDLDFEPELGATTLPSFKSLAEEAEEHDLGELPTFGTSLEEGIEDFAEAEPELPQEAPLAEELAMEQPEEDIGTIDFDTFAPPPAAEAPVVEENAEGELTLPDLDFSGIDLDLSEEEKPAEEVAPTPVAEEMEVPSSIDPDLLEEVNTKLDLAKAYLEMGDREGAREILDEVLKEGDAHQKQAAESMMAEIG